MRRLHRARRARYDNPIGVSAPRGYGIARGASRTHATKNGKALCDPRIRLGQTAASAVTCYRCAKLIAFNTGVPVKKAEFASKTRGKRRLHVMIAHGREGMVFGEVPPQVAVEVPARITRRRRKLIAGPKRRRRARARARMNRRRR